MSAKAPFPVVLTSIVLIAMGWSTTREAAAEPITISPTMPTVIAGGADPTPTQLYTFAWEEFVAATWPAKPRNPSAPPDPTKPAWTLYDATTGWVRGEPDTTAIYGQTGANGTVVFETYKHKNEIFGSNIATIQKASSYAPPTPPAANPGANQLPPFDSGIGYGYFSAPPQGGTGNPSFAWLNNLDEGNEIKFADMYFTPFTEQSSTYGISAILFEARQDQIAYDYVRTYGLQNSTVRGDAAKRTVDLITTGVQSPPVDASLPLYIEFPLNAIEAKATWRFYGGSNEPDEDALTRYHNRTVIYYDEAGNYYNATFLLVGLHIIQKTSNFNLFTFATFEHVDNEKNGFLFNNLNNSAPKGYIPQGLQSAIRQHKLPDGTVDSNNDLVSFNSAVQAQLGNVVWANYQLTGVQAKPGNLPPTPTGGNPKGPIFQQYFLANLATETNSSLQYFTGGRDGDNLPIPGMVNTYQPTMPSPSTTYDKFVTGGCMGCHGFGAQSMGYDFSFLLQGAGGLSIPDGITLFPSGELPTPQNASGIKNSGGDVVINPVQPQPLTD